MQKYGTAQAIENTNNVYNIFKYAHKLNSDLFRDMKIEEVTEKLIQFVKPADAISVKMLKDRITAYSATYDTGILF